MSTPDERVPTHRYTDPVDLIWLGLVERIGLAVVRSDEVFASFDGRDTLTISTPEALDDDDCLAQMILHELCHALVGGPGAGHRVDWGLDNTSDADLVSEHACHRLQAALAAPFGLRDFMAVTTQWRPYYDALPFDPLGSGDDPAIEPARAGYERATTGPWAAAINDALAATAKVAELVRAVGLGETSLWAVTGPAHPLGGKVAGDGRTCGECAWRFVGGRGSPVVRCRRHRPAAAKTAPRIENGWPACEVFEQRLDADSCAGCGACCRQAYNMVDVGSRERVVSRHMHLLTLDEHGFHLMRPDGHCVALEAPDGGAPYRCRIYADRPDTCRDFELSGDHCLDARRRLGISR